MIKLLQHYSLWRIKNLLFLSLSNMPMPGHFFRPWIVRFGGVDIKKPSSCFIGKNVGWDSVAPQKIHIGEGTVITSKTSIVTHYRNTKTGAWYQGDVRIGNNCFIGLNSIITKDVVIGDNVIIGAGSIVTKNIPDNEIWAGNPAKCIGKRGDVH